MNRMRKALFIVTSLAVAFVGGGALWAAIRLPVPPASLGPRLAETRIQQRMPTVNLQWPKAGPSVHERIQSFVLIQTQA